MSHDDEQRPQGIRSRVVGFLVELRRRKVFRAGSIYLIAMWTLALGAAELFPAFGLPDWGVRLFVIAGILGFPLVIIGAWLFEITSEGVLLDHAARSPRQDTAMTELGSGATTTMWVQAHQVNVSWEDESGAHEQSFLTDFVMGRDPSAGLWIDDPRISRLHARVSYERGLWWIEDLDSRNGTNVDGRLITSKTPLEGHATVYLYDRGHPITLDIASVGEEP